jgi:peroxiredoxin
VTDASAERTIVTAPDFTLTDQSGADWTLSDHRDAAVLLVFYRGDW